MQETFGPLLSEVCCVFPLAEVGFSEVGISGAGNAPPLVLGCAGFSAGIVPPQVSPGGLPPASLSFLFRSPIFAFVSAILR